MNLSSLVKIVKRSKKRVGRGYGSGKGGHNSGRGSKGQKVRSKVGLLFEGTKSKKSLVKRLPLLRGKGKFKPKKRVLALDVGKFSDWPKNKPISLVAIFEEGLSSGEKFVKIVGRGELPSGVEVSVPVSRGVKVQEGVKKGKIKTADE